MPQRFDTLTAMVAAQTEAHGAKIGLRSPTRELSYAMIADHSARIATALVAAGVKPGDRIAYLGRNSVDYYPILFGAAMCGAVLVAVNWRLARPEIAWILEDSEAKLVFADSEFAGAASVAPRMVLLDDFAAWRDGHDATPVAHRADPEDVAVQLYTSGTTGRPKGATLCNRALLAFRSLPPDEQPEWNRWSDDDVSLIVMPQFHIGGTGFGLQTLCAGATGLVMTDFDAGRVLDAIEKERLSKVFTVPSAIRLLIDHPRARSIDYSRIRTLVYGASPIPLDLLREAMAVFGCGFVQQYGMTETCGTICALPPEEHHVDGTLRMRSAGKPLPGVDVRILDSAGHPLPNGETGEIAIHAQTLMNGYWNNEAATREAIDGDGYFRSGDAGMLDADGYLYIQDRIKDMIVSGGENVYPAEVEAVLSSHPDIAEVAVIGVPDAKWGEAVKAIVVAANGATIDPPALIAWARERLAGYKLPKTIDRIDALPRNAGGKVLRRTLRDPYWAGRERKVN